MSKRMAKYTYDIFHLRETNVRQIIAQLIFSLHKDILFCKVVIPFKGQFKDQEYTIKCDILQLEKKKQTDKVNLLQLFDGHNSSQFSACI